MPLVTPAPWYFAFLQNEHHVDHAMICCQHRLHLGPLERSSLSARAELRAIALSSPEGAGCPRTVSLKPVMLGLGWFLNPLFLVLTEAFSLVLV